jgi:rRNA maturation endonuclease Nob1
VSQEATGKVPNGGAPGARDGTNDEADRFVVLRCASCGDTFPTTASEQEVTCPSCGSKEVQQAHEPLL